MITINSISLWLTPKCNLRCAYCFQKERDRSGCSSYGKHKASKEVIDKLADFCLESGIKRIEFFGGEPLYYREIFKYTITHLCRKVKGLSVGIVTNGTLIDEVIMKLFEKYSIAVLLSLDGGKAGHNALRGGFEKISPWFLRLIGLKNISIALQAGMVPGLYQNIHDVWQIGFKRVFVNVIENYGWYTRRDINLFEDEYEKTILGMLDGRGILTCALRIHDGLNGDVYIKECGIIRRGISCDWNGFLYPCHRAVEMGKAFAIGSIYKGIDAEMEKNIRSKIEIESFKSRNSKKYELVSFCPVAIFQNQGKLDGKWNSDFCEMIEIKNKLVAKYHYQIESFLESLSKMAEKQVASV